MNTYQCSLNLSNKIKLVNAFPKMKQRTMCLANFRKSGYCYQNNTENLVVFFSKKQLLCINPQSYYHCQKNTVSLLDNIFRATKSVDKLEKKRVQASRGKVRNTSMGGEAMEVS